MTLVMNRREMLKLSATALAGLSLGINLANPVEGFGGGSMQKLRVSDNRRFLVKGDGTPFIWIGDTAWNCYKLPPSEQSEYLARRKEQGFTVIQTIIGPFKEMIPRDSDEFKRSDQWLEKIGEHGLYAAPVLMWGHQIKPKQYTKERIYDYAKWIGHRYRDMDHIIWMTLGEGTVQDLPSEKVMPLVNGLRDGDTGNKILSIHANNRTSTSLRYHDDMDFNNWQTSQWSSPSDLPDYENRGWWTGKHGDWNAWEAIEHDYKKQPIKPTLDAEAWYESSPKEPAVHVGEANPKRKEFGQGEGSQAYHVRRRAYFSVFAGGMGHTYGAEAIWQAVRRGESAKGVGLPHWDQEKKPSWQDAVEFPGGNQMQHLHRLLASKPVLNRIPDQSMVVDGQSDSYDSHVQAARGSDGSYAFIYIADGHKVSVDLSKMAGGRILAKWYNPRDGKYSDIGPIEKTNSVSFDPPGTPHFTNDWVLVLDVK